MPTLEVDGAVMHYRWDGREDGPVVMLANSLGSNLSMWDGQIATLARRFRVLRYDLRGHGSSAVTAGPYSVEQLGRDVIALLDRLGVPRVHFCGLSLGGMVGMWLGVNAPERIDRLVLCNTTAMNQPPEVWNARIEAVNQGGVAAVVETVLERWFTPAFRQRDAAAVDRVRTMLLATDPRGYAGGCAAVRDMDQRESIARIVAPTLVIGGTHDPGMPPPHSHLLVQRIPGACYVELPAAHLSNVEAEEAFNRALSGFLDQQETGMSESARYDQGMEVRRAVLGDAYVDRAMARRNAVNSEFQELITRYAWGEVWTRPGLPRHTRSLITIAMLIALNRGDEFRLHVRAAANNRVTRDQIKEVLLQSAIYCGVPAANTAFHLAQEVFAEMDAADKQGRAT